MDERTDASAAAPAQPAEPEHEVEDAFERLVQEGRQRLRRPIFALLATGMLGGIDVGTGVLAYLVVKAQTHNPLLAGLAFSIGFVALLLARSELFTENFLVPVIAAVAGEGGGPIALARLWAVTLVTNLAGGWVMAWLIVGGLPGLKTTVLETGTHYAHLGATRESFALAVLAGAIITLMTRMQHSTESLGVQLVPAILFGALSGRWAALPLRARFAVHVRGAGRRGAVRLPRLAARAGLVGAGQRGRWSGAGDRDPAAARAAPGVGRAG